ncbi:helix-turn-helix domain-containing protein [Cereibacter changlensis]|uniref:helix-turn-helix domain-containing protein n=1 Tax=Cereibacter changlensis TaxID=402884 RepID=UPI004034BD1F
MTRISDSDRALIDAALAAGRLRRIPRGVSGLPVAVWDGAKLVYPEKDGGPSPKQGLSFARTTAPPELRARRAAVASLHAQGLCVTAIAAELGVHPQRVRDDHAVLRLAPHKPPERGKAGAVAAGDPPPRAAPGAAKAAAPVKPDKASAAAPAKEKAAVKTAAPGAAPAAAQPGKSPASAAGPGWRTAA